MCGIVGYIGKSNSRPFVMEGLSRLEYRGYDSAGFACINPHDNRFLYAKSSGSLHNLVRKIESHPIDGLIGVGHTRWSTHGVPSEENAHPQFDCHKKICLVHNGIVENHLAIKKQLQASGHTFHSQTDTETIAHLLESLLETHQTLKSALLDLVGQIEGAYAFLFLLEDYPDQMLLIRKRSPLCVGINAHEKFVSSDPLAFAGKTKKVLFMPDESIAIIKKETIELFDFMGTPLPVAVQELHLDYGDIEKQGHAHHMLKEIYDQKSAIYNTVTFLRSISNRLWDHVGLSKEQAKAIEKINLIGCGTSWHAARIAQFFFEQIVLFPRECIWRLNSGICHFFLKKIVHTFLFHNQGKRPIRLNLCVW